MEPLPSFAWSGEEEEWELYNDDGFIYKRKKRRRLAGDDLDAVAASKSSDVLGDPEADEKKRRERKKKTLLKLKEKYQREIDHWELLSNALRGMEEKVRNQPREQGESEELPSVSGLVVRETEDASGALLDELLLQAEAQEAIIHGVSNLCTVAESMCNAQEEQLKQSYFDLPIWGSPRELMASLCDE